MPTSPPDLPTDSGKVTLFLDANLDGRIVAEALRKTGAKVERHIEHFAGETLDVDWIPLVAAQNWVIIPRDRKIISRSLEVEVVRRAGTALFVFISGELSAAQMAAILTQNLPKILEISATHPRPFIAKLYRDGQIAFVTGQEPTDEEA